MVVDLLIDKVFAKRPHYVRLSAVDGGKRPPLGMVPPTEQCGVASAQWLCYERDRVFEMLPGLLAAIHQRDRSGHVVIEADADPVLRYAYPYDEQLFVIPAPDSLESVFRSSVQAARALQDVLDDTAEFAVEMFGLAPAPSYPDDDSHHDRKLLTKSEIRRFLDTPLGDQLAHRIQLRPEYHGLVESDVVLVNTAAGGTPAMTDGCCRRLERLLLPFQSDGEDRRALFCCNPANPADPERAKFLDSIRSLCLQHD